MDNSYSLASRMQGSFATKVTSRKQGLSREKVVMISSHPAWLQAHDAADGNTAADSVDMVRIFHEVLERMRHAPVLNVDDEPVTVGQMIDQVWRRLKMEEAPLRLSQMLRIARTERAVICLELALLELVRLQAVLLQQDRSVCDILLSRNGALPRS